MRAECHEVDGLKLMTHMLQRFALAPAGTEVEIAIGDVFEGREHLGHAAVILTIAGVRGVFPIADAVLFMREVGRAAEAHRALTGSIPQSLADIADFAGQVLAAVAAYHASEAALRARAH